MLSDEFNKDIRKWSAYKLEREYERMFAEEMKPLPISKQRELIGKEILRRHKREDEIKNYHPT
tara:strand:+ start:3541 stop:3729 length:189 start_codon:yes stop_codon:yes gene_type:complete